MLVRPENRTNMPALPVELNEPGREGSAGDDLPERTRVAIVSLLFNWPSTGGGTVHTAETAMFLARSGYQVRHFYAVYPEWRLGIVTEPLPYPAEAIRFDESSWNAETIRRRFRTAVDRFDPDFVIITDSWNFKPLLAHAMRGHRYFLRLAALECLCPLNNVRLLVQADGTLIACPKHQLATPAACRACVWRHEQLSGSLHRAERQLSGFGTEQYDRQLRSALAEAEAVLCVNPLIAEMVRPYARQVRVVPSGFDPDRFPWSEWPQNGETSDGPVRILFAGLVQEVMKGFSVLHEACRRLWAQRHDFELWATADPPGPVDAFTRYVGWQRQSELPRLMRKADVLVFPTVAEEALGRSAVEAMGAGRPVVASRIGGLPFTVVDELTGFLFEPGNLHDLVRQLSRLLDDPGLRQRLGAAGRRRFEEHFTWPVVIERHYRPLLARRAERTPNISAPPAAGTADGAVEERHRLALPDRTVEIPLLVRGPVDRAIIRDLWERDCYRLGKLMDQAPQAVVDVGAHIGTFALLATERWPGARVVACEADPDNVRLLHWNVRNRAAVELVEAAVVSHDVREIDFYHVPDKATRNSGGGSCLRPEPASVRIRVPAVPIVQLWADKGLADCDLLKLDCEGAEIPLLRALAAARLLGGIRWIVGEWHALDPQPRSTARVCGELEEILSPTHQVEFAPCSRGREGHFTARRLRGD